MIAIWTNTNDVVTRQHHRPEQLPDSATSDAFLVESIPDDAAGPDEVPTLHYTEADGFWYTYQTKETELPISPDEEDRLRSTVEDGDVSAVFSIVEKLLNNQQ